MLYGNIIDSHAHYDDEAFDRDRESLLGELPEKGICAAVNVSASMETAEKTISLTERYPYIYGALGVHPNETAGLTEEDMQWLEARCSLPKIVAVGEIGLDYYWDKPERDVQKLWFSRQIELARKVGLPMIIHSRDAAADTLDMIRSHRGGEIGGVIHCFSYGVELAREYLNMGFYLGIGGVLTFKNARKLKEVAAYAPIERILLETDCPYLAPVPNRGKRNSSLNLPYVAEALADIKDMTAEEVVRITAENVRACYRMDKDTETEG